MSFKAKGEQGEAIAIKILKLLGVDSVRRPDLVFRVKDKWFSVEVKNKEPFEPPPDYMQGIPQTQFLKDLDINSTGLTTILLVRGKENEWLAQFMVNLIARKDPRKIQIMRDNLVWFELGQFEPAFDFFETIIKGDHLHVYAKEA